MTTKESWQRIKEIFDSAQRCVPAERASFIREACGGDESVRREVESLLAADVTNQDFLGTPAYEFLAGVLAEESEEFVAGQEVGPYTILSSLGSGGMGEVYLAHDRRLGRKIALKLLPSRVAADDQRVRRFEQEARTASALNHPNVCMIHEVGKTEEGRHFIAMEYVDGITLRARMLHQLMPLAEALDVGAQIAWALEAAHAAGVVHRDIKPENIMLRRDGYVKVLDFGIAKLNENLSGAHSINEASTIARVNTEPGTRMGTVKYMSPEQLRERPIDERTDIWSLGVVLHEMVTGTTPFEARTTNETIAAILEKQPPGFASYSTQVPEEFRQIVKKALSKKRRERYQRVKDLAADLRKLRRKIEAKSPEEPEVRQVPIIEKAEGMLRGEEHFTGGDRGTRLDNTKTRVSSTAESILTEIKEHKKAAMFVGVAAVLAVLLVIPGFPIVVSRIQNFFHQSQLSTGPLQMMKMTPLTNSGQSVCAAISSDGKYVAHAEKKDGMQQLLLTGIITAGTSVVVPSADVNYLGLAFSRDGNYLYFTRTEKSDAGILYQIALPGSAPRKVKDGVDSPITFSPNGDRFSFVRHNRAAGEYSLMIAGVDGADERSIATRRNGKRLSVGGPAWTPDGQTIVCAAGWWDKGYHMNLMEIDTEDGHEKVIGAEQWFSILQAAWLEDKSGLIISAREQPMAPAQLWLIPYPRGKPSRITTDTTDYWQVSLTGNTIVAVQNQQIAQIWVAPDGDAQRAKAIASGIGLSFGLGWTGKGKIVFSSMAGNNLNISLIDPNGANQSQLTVNAGDNYSPSGSSDGRFIVFASNRSGSFNIWRMNAEDGSDPRQLTFTDGNFYPSCSADSQWVAYDNQSEATLSVWKVSIAGGEPQQLTEEYARMPVVSPDNQLIACRYYVENGLQGIAVIPAQGGPPIKLLPIPILDFQQVQWTSNGRALMYIKTTNGTSNIWSYDLNGGASRQLTDFKTEKIYAYVWSSDYKQLACERGADIGDVMIITRQR